MAEYDWQKIKDIEFQEMLRTKTTHLKRLRNEFQCTKCPDLNEHVSYIYIYIYKQDEFFNNNNNILLLSCVTTMFFFFFLVWFNSCT